MRWWLTVREEPVAAQARSKAHHRILPWRESHGLENKKTPNANAIGVFFFRSLTMTYSHMGKPHTTIGDAPFHC
jgi:hypothetical protein